MFWRTVKEQNLSCPFLFAKIYKSIIVIYIYVKTIWHMIFLKNYFYNQYNMNKSLYILIALVILSSCDSLENDNITNVNNLEYSWHRWSILLNTPEIEKIDNTDNTDNIEKWTMGIILSKSNYSITHIYSQSNAKKAWLEIWDIVYSVDDVVLKENPILPVWNVGSIAKVIIYRNSVKKEFLIERQNENIKNNSEKTLDEASKDIYNNIENNSIIDIEDKKEENNDWNITSKIINTATYNSRSFIFTNFNLIYWEPQRKTSKPLIIPNWTSKLTATFSLSKDWRIVTLSSASENITCDTWYIINARDCKIKQDSYPQNSVQNSVPQNSVQNTDQPKKITPPSVPNNQWGYKILNSSKPIKQDTYPQNSKY